jgi:hypothetical protein
MKTFKDYWKALTPGQKKHLSDCCGYSNDTYLSQIAHGKKKAGVTTISKLNRVDTSLTPQFMRPDLYGGDRKHKPNPDAA